VARDIPQAILHWVTVSSGSSGACLDGSSPAKRDFRELALAWLDCQVVDVPSTAYPFRGVQRRLVTVHRNPSAMNMGRLFVRRQLLQFLVEKSTLNAKTTRGIGLVASRKAKRAVDQITFPPGNGFVERQIRPAL
jgi:hypothetical protein